MKKNRLKKLLENWQFLFDGSLLQGFSPKSSFAGFKQILKLEKLTIFDGKIDVSHAYPRFPSKYVSNFLLFLKGIKRGEWPFLTFFISVTDKCPSNCIYCYNDSANKCQTKAELSLDKIKKILLYLKKNEPTIFQCCITGGEPMIRKDILEIVEESSKYFFTFLNTSGFGFTEKQAKQLKKIGLGTLKISLDYFDPDVVNERRGNPLAFEKAVNAIKISVKNGLYTSVGAVASKHLLVKENFLKFIDFLENLGVDDLRLYPYKKTGKALETDDKYFTAEEEKIIGEYQLLINRNKKLKIKMMSMTLVESGEVLGCNAGNRQLYINSDGSVSPCPCLTLSLGNIHKESLRTIIQRLKDCFPKPRRFCSTNYLTKRKVDLNKLRIENNIEKNCKILKDIPKTDLPDFYKKIL